MPAPEGNQNAATHGVYSKDVTPERRSARMELSEQLETRDGVREALKDMALDTLTMARAAQSYCIKRYGDGAHLDDIPLLRALPAFWNAAGRALKAYLDALPPEPDDVIDINELRGKYGDEQHS